MPNFINLPSFTEDGDVCVVVETPRGSRAKFDFDPRQKTFTLSKSLLTGLTYPHDWGFVPSTKADDGDPIDIMVVHDAATFPGIVLTCRVIGVLQIKQKSKGKTERNDRLFAVPKESHSEKAIKDVSDLSNPIREELEKFFQGDRRARRQETQYHRLERAQGGCRSDQRGSEIIQEGWQVVEELAACCLPNRIRRRTLCAAEKGLDFFFGRRIACHCGVRT